MAEQNILQKDPITNPVKGAGRFYFVDVDGTVKDHYITDEVLRKYLDTDDHDVVTVDISGQPTGNNSVKDRLKNALNALPLFTVDKKVIYQVSYILDGKTVVERYRNLLGLGNYGQGGDILYSTAQDNQLQPYGRASVEGDSGPITFSGNVPVQEFTLNINHAAAGDTYDKVRDAINALPTFNLSDFAVQSFRTVRFVVNSNGGGIETDPVTGLRFDAIYEFYDLKFNYQTLGQNGEQLSAPGRTLLKLSGSDSTVSLQATQTDLGDIGAQQIQSYINANGPWGTPRGAFNAFKAIQNGETKVWLYVGPEDQIGTGLNPTVETNADQFYLIPDDIADADPDPDSRPAEYRSKDQNGNSFVHELKDIFGPGFTVTPSNQEIGGRRIDLNSATSPFTSALSTVNAQFIRDAIDDNYRRLGYVAVSDFGAKGDGVQLSDWSVTGVTLSSPSYTFSSLDVGKAVSIADAGASGEHLVTTVASVDTGANTATLSLTATTNVTGKLGSIGTDNIKPFQDAFDYGIQNNIEVRASDGLFLIGDENPDNGFKQVRLLFTQEGQNFKFKGRGQGRTIIQDIDGKVQRIGNFTSTFYCNFPNTISVGNISIEGLTLDKNGRSLTVAPSPITAWEQSHAIYFVKSTTGLSNCKGYQFHNIEIKDKIGGGISCSTMNVQFGPIRISNITSIDYSGNDGIGIQYAQRGDLEIHSTSDSIVIDSVDIGYMQYEPTATYFTNKDRRRTVNISNSKIDDLEPTETSTDAEDVKYNILNMVNVVSNSFTPRGVSWNMENCRVKINETFNSVDGTATNSRIYVPYDDVANSVGTLTMVNYTPIPNKIKYDNCKFLIDSDDPTITPTGYAITHSGSLASNNLNQVDIINCEFDSRFQMSVDAQNNGTWRIKNSLMAGSLRVFLIGATSTYTSRVILENNDYSQVPDGTLAYTLSNGNTNWTAVFNERVPQAKWQTGTSGSTGNTDVQIEAFPTLLIDDIANRTNFKRKGCVFEVTVAAASGYKYYQVTSSGAGLSATVKGFGLLES